MGDGDIEAYGLEPINFPSRHLLTLLCKESKCRADCDCATRVKVMLLFKKKFLNLIRQGTKTQTIRIWPHRKLRVGQRSYIPGVGYIRIAAVDAVELNDLTNDDATLDGFANIQELRDEIQRLYPDGLTGGQQAYRVRFSLLSPAEQQQAIAEREARKREGEAN